MTAINDRPRTVHPAERWNSPYRYHAQAVRIVPTLTVVDPGVATDTAPIAIPTQVAAMGPKHALFEPATDAVAESISEDVAELAGGPAIEDVTETVVGPVAETIVGPAVEPVIEDVAEPESHPVTEPVAAVVAPTLVPNDAPKRPKPMIAALRRLEAGHWTLIGLVAANATLIPIAIVTKG